MIWNTQTHKPTHRHTHTYTRRCCCETNTHSRSRTCLGNATSSQQLMDVAKSKEERNTKKKNEHSRRRRPSFWVHNREKGRKNQEREFFGIKQCFLYQQRKKGPAWETERAGDSRPDAPRLRSPSHFSLLPAVSLFFFPLISPALPPSSSSPKKGHTRTLFPFLESHVYSVSNVVDGRSWMTDRRCMYVCF